MAALQTPGDGNGMDLELTLHGPDPAPDLPDLVAGLKETGANQVTQLRVAAPAPGKRDAGGLLTVITLAVGGVANLSTVFDTVYKWLGARKTRAARQPALPAAGEQVPSVVLTIGGDSITLAYPPDWVQSQAVKQFLQEHGQAEVRP